MSIAFKARRSAFDLAVVVGTILMTLCAVLSIASPNTDSVAAVFPPWWGAPRAFEAAAGVGDIAGVGRWTTVLILRGPREGLAPRLRAAGALLVVAAGPFIGCARPTKGNSK